MNWTEWKIFCVHFEHFEIIWPLNSIWAERMEIYMIFSHILFCLCTNFLFSLRVCTCRLARVRQDDEANGRTWNERKKRNEICMQNSKMRNERRKNADEWTKEKCFQTCIFSERSTRVVIVIVMGTSTRTDRIEDGSRMRETKKFTQIQSSVVGRWLNWITCAGIFAIHILFVFVCWNPNKLLIFVFTILFRSLSFAYFLILIPHSLSFFSILFLSHFFVLFPSLFFSRFVICFHMKTCKFVRIFFFFFFYHFFPYSFHFYVSFSIPLLLPVANALRGENDQLKRWKG